MNLPTFLLLYLAFVALIDLAVSIAVATSLCLPADQGLVFPRYGQLGLLTAFLAHLIVTAILILVLF